MFRLKSQALSSFFLSLLLMLGTVGLIGCDRDRVEITAVTNIAPKAEWVTTRQLSETSPPKVIQELNRVLDQYQPQVKILSPQPGETLTSTTVEVKLSLQDLPTFQDLAFKLGPHLHLIVDNNPYIAIYDPSQPYTISDLTPGTHTLRVFASRPWHESFKNEGAYAQVTFNVLTSTGDNSPDPNLPVLTFSRPKGELGAEPILLDYYLTNAPLHGIAQENTEDEIADWRIRVTVNGESFVVDRWQPIYLKGFKEGDNWVQLEFLNDKGDRIDNVFNNTVRLITYHPKGEDTLSKITRGELTVEQVRQIVDPTYRPTKEETVPQAVDAKIAPEPASVDPEVAVPRAEAQEDEEDATNQLPSVTEAAPSEAETVEPETKAVESALEDGQPENLEPLREPGSPLTEPVIEPIVEPIVELEVESTPDVILKPVLEPSASPAPLSVEPAIAKPESNVPSAPKAIAPSLDQSEDQAEPETETITSTLDKIFEQKTIQEKAVEPGFPDIPANSQEEKPLSPGIRYFDEVID